MKYDFKKVEQKWQQIWEQEHTFAVGTDFTKPKFFPLVEFPYPSGQGLHVGHPRSYTGLDIVSRKRRLEGYNVLYTMGWDAFGLPTENFAIKHQIHPEEVTENNVKNFKRQLKSLGISFDWDREINTTDPNYYKWTQWIFIQLFKKGLAYKAKMNVNYCPDCKVVLANEEVIQGGCERCGGEVVQKNKEQWMLKITAYADQLIDGLEGLDFIERVKSAQTHWIGKSVGARLEFSTTNQDKISVFTTRVDTIFGVTYLVLSPEHPLIDDWKAQIQNFEELLDYRTQSSKKSDFERSELAKDKTGVKVQGVSGIHPITQELLPIYLSDYVLMSYGTGGVMAVPAHDERDYAFAKTFHLPIRPVISGGTIEEEAFTKTGNNPLIHSEFLNGLNAEEGKKVALAWLEEKGVAKAQVNYKLRDWVFARQRYWGEPIPIVICDCCGYVPLEEQSLPLTLPKVNSFQQTQDGESPLAALEDWVHVPCPSCGKPAKRETDTMPQWAGSSWYYLRYTDPKNETALASKEALDYWLPVDWYNGGMEHTTLHLLYSRFWHKVLYDLGVVPTPEPYAKRTSHGMILGENGEKMSKSKGNVVNPDDIIGESGADTLRLYEMFIGDFEKSAPWNESSIKGCERFLQRVWGLLDFFVPEEGHQDGLEHAFHKTIKKVTLDIEQMKFNTAIAGLMSLLNDIYGKKKITKTELKIFLILLNPFTPHITEEIWERVGFDGQISKTTWVTYEEEKCKDEVWRIPVQINGKVKDVLEVSPDTPKEEILSLAKKIQKIEKEIQGKNLLKEIYVPNKIINIVIK